MVRAVDDIDAFEARSDISQVLLRRDLGPSLVACVSYQQ